MDTEVTQSAAATPLTLIPAFPALDKFLVYLCEIATVVLSQVSHNENTPKLACLLMRPSRMHVWSTIISLKQRYGSLLVCKTITPVKAR